MDNLIIKPNIILVGKPNVGKSTLFNRLAHMKISIAHKTKGATRDVISRAVNILGNDMVIYDSGGLENEDPNNPFNDLVTKRVKQFIEQKAHLVLFLVSAKDGITNQDKAIASNLRKIKIPVILVINKVDDEKNFLLASDCFSFGFSDCLSLSATQNKGLDELKNLIIKRLGLTSKSKEGQISLVLEDEFKNKPVRIAIVGRCNTGKSTFVNAILNEDRLMTSSIAGTTLDAVDTTFFYGGKEIILIDTAGIRRQRGVFEEIEKMAIARSLCAMDRADITVLMINAQEGITEQDKKIAGMIFSKRKAVIIAINKWDETISKENTKENFIESIKFHLPFLSFSPILFLSAKYNKNIFDILEISLRLSPRIHSEINTSKLNRSLQRAQEAHPAPVENGKRIKFFFAKQVDKAPQTFTITSNMPHKVHFSYERYLSNFLRKDLKLEEIPIRLIFRKKSKNEELVL